jgi:hypothetical protein
MVKVELKVAYPNDAHQCEFNLGVTRSDGLHHDCQNIATRQVFLRITWSDDDGDYMWVCDDCMPAALEYWAETEIAVEF